MTTPSAGEYWNHNTAFHPELVAALPHSRATVLGVGCGDGLLLQRLAARGAVVTGIDRDAAAVALAHDRLSGVRDARLIFGDLLTSPELDGERFELITLVAVLQHLPLEDALRRLELLLVPGGRLRVVGLAANKSTLDWILFGLALHPIRVLSKRREESAYDGMKVAQPRESVDEIRRAAGRVLPGSTLRRRFWYRYSLEWTKPGAA